MTLWASKIPYNLNSEAYIPFEMSMNIIILPGSHSFDGAVMVFKVDWCSSQSVT